MLGWQTAMSWKTRLQPLLPGEVGGGTNVKQENQQNHSYSAGCPGGSRQVACWRIAEDKGVPTELRTEG